jgi:hypothetical protein
MTENPEYWWIWQIILVIGYIRIIIPMWFSWEEKLKPSPKLLKAFITISMFSGVWWLWDLEHIIWVAELAGIGQKI